MPFYVISMLLIVASRSRWSSRSGLNLGVDFVGGQMIRVTFTERQDAPVAELREEVDALGYGEPIIQQFGEAERGFDPHDAARRWRRNPEPADAMTTQDDRRRSAGQFADARIDGVDSVSGKVSGELFTTGDAGARCSR